MSGRTFLGPSGAGSKGERSGLEAGIWPASGAGVVEPGRSTETVSPAVPRSICTSPGGGVAVEEATRQGAGVGLLDEQEPGLRTDGVQLEPACCGAGGAARCGATRPLPVARGCDCSLLAAAAGAGNSRTRGSSETRERREEDSSELEEEERLGGH